MNTTTKRYRLLKDLDSPGILCRKGTVSEKGDFGYNFLGESLEGGKSDGICIQHPENYPSWFEEVRDAPKFKVEWIGYNDCNFDGYISKFRHSTKFDMELFTKISKAIEDIVNGVEAPDIDQLQRQAFEAARYSIAHPLMPFTHHLEFNTYEDYKNSKK